MPIENVKGSELKRKWSLIWDTWVNSKNKNFIFVTRSEDSLNRQCKTDTHYFLEFTYHFIALDASYDTSERMAWNEHFSPLIFNDVFKKKKKIIIVHL